MDTNEMPTIQVSRRFDVTGEVGAEFEIIALESGTLKYISF